MAIQFKGYITNNPALAEKLYVEKTGYEPTLLVCSPNGSPMISVHPNMVLSRFGPANTVLVTHLATPQELSRRYGEFDAVQSISIHSIPQISYIPDELNRPRTRGRPKKAIFSSQTHSSTGVCPHCQQKITDFNNLGWWYGWNLGIEPPYWEDLRLYVLRRDDFTCQSCHNRFSAKDLVCHHILPKETGGVDGARNLGTMCLVCHPDDKPIFEENI